MHSTGVTSATEGGSGDVEPHSTKHASRNVSPLRSGIDVMMTEEYHGPPW